jgi:hypothetical protein
VDGDARELQHMSVFLRRARASAMAGCDGPLTVSRNC